MGLYLASRNCPVILLDSLGLKPSMKSFSFIGDGAQVSLSPAEIWMGVNYAYSSPDSDACSAVFKVEIKAREPDKKNYEILKPIFFWDNQAKRKFAGYIHLLDCYEGNPEISTSPSGGPYDPFWKHILYNEIVVTVSYRIYEKNSDVKGAWEDPVQFDEGRQIDMHHAQKSHMMWSNKEPASFAKETETTAGGSYIITIRFDEEKGAYTHKSEPNIPKGPNRDGKEGDGIWTLPEETDDAEVPQPPASPNP